MTIEPPCPWASIARRLGLAGQPDALHVDVHQGLVLILLPSPRWGWHWQYRRRSAQGAMAPVSASVSRHRVGHRRHPRSRRPAICTRIASGRLRSSRRFRPAPASVRLIQKRHIRPALRQPQRDALADPAARAGDQGPPVRTGRTWRVHSVLSLTCLSFPEGTRLPIGRMVCLRRGARKPPRFPIRFL